MNQGISNETYGEFLCAPDAPRGGWRRLVEMEEVQDQARTAVEQPNWNPGGWVGAAKAVKLSFVVPTSFTNGLT